MSATTTTLSGTITASASTVTLAAYTAPSGRSKPLLKVDDEIMLIVDASNSPTLGVARGYMGTVAIGHRNLAAVQYGRPGDMQTSKGPTQAYPSLSNPYILGQSQGVTATGATGSTAASITAGPPAFLMVTGTSGAGINLPYPQPGASYEIQNGTTGAVNVYCVGATINGTTGTTAFSLTATGNKLAFANCATAGAWLVAGNT